MDNEKTNGSKNQLPHTSIDAGYSRASKTCTRSKCSDCKANNADNNCQCQRTASAMLNDPVVFNELFRSL